MNDVNSIVEVLKIKLQPLEYVHALWIEGSRAQGHGDEYSDIDVWLGVDDNRVFTIFPEVEAALQELADIDFHYVVKKEGELGQNVYHLKGMSEFLTIDINTQSLSRQVPLVKGIDDAEIIFDKKGVVQFKERDALTADIEAKRQKLRAFYQQMRPSLRKNILRQKPLEALYYYHMILGYAVRFLRLKYGVPEKADFGLKHIYRDVPKEDVEKLEYFYSVKPSEVEGKLEELRSWIESL